MIIKLRNVLQWMPLDIVVTLYSLQLVEIEELKMEKIVTL